MVIWRSHSYRNFNDLLKAVGESFQNDHPSWRRSLCIFLLSCVRFAKRWAVAAESIGNLYHLTLNGSDLVVFFSIYWTTNEAMKPDRSKHHIPGFCPLKNAFTKRLQRGEVKEDIEKRLPDFSKYVDPQKAHWLLRMFAARPQPKYTQLTVDIYIYILLYIIVTYNICVQ